MKTVSICLCLLPLMALPALAQSGAKPRKTETAPKRQALFMGNGSATWLPKNSILPTADRIEAIAKNIGARQRNMDPFGLSMFPRENAAPLFEDDTLREAPRVTLNQALQTLKINGVNLARKEFLIGGRNIFEGDVIEMVFKGETFQAQVLEISHAELRFRDLIRDEAGVLLHSVIPSLPLEPLQKLASRLEGRLTPMEPAKAPTSP